MNKGICFLGIDGVVNTYNFEYKNNKFYAGYYYWKDKKINMLY